MSNFNGDFDIVSASLIVFGFAIKYKNLEKNYLNNYCLQLCMTKISFSAVKGNIEMTRSFSVISPNLCNLLASYVITTYVTHQKKVSFCIYFEF